MVTEISFTDSHCHLNFPEFDQDLAMVVGRARDAGLERMLIPGVNIETCHEALSLADEYPEVYAAIGVHPNSALSWVDETYRELEEMSKHPKVVAIGEIGLDYYRKGAPVELQKQVFQVQLELASNLGLPVIIHNREASDEVQEILDAWINSLTLCKSGLVHRPGVLHSFSGDLNEARWACTRNFFIGITGPVTYKNAIRMQQVARDIPLSSILIETDAPYLPPHPHRGKRNEPAHVAIIAGKIAELRTIDTNEVTRVTSENAERLFGWRKID